MQISRRRAVLGLLLPLFACTEAAEDPRTPTRPMGSPPARVLAANSSAFDLLVDLLPRDRLVAIPAPALEWSPLPGGREAWTDFPVLERFEGELLLALDADLLVVSSWSDQAPIAIAREAGIAILELPDASTWAELVDTVRVVGAAVGAKERALELVADLEARRAALATRAGTPLRILPYANFGAGGTTAGGDTTVDLLIRLAGHRNAAAEAGLVRHSDLDLEQVLAIDPDLFLTASGRDGVHPGANFLRGEDVLKGLRAIQEDAIVVLPAELYSTASHRVLDAAEELASRLRR